MQNSTLYVQFNTWVNKQCRSWINIGDVVVCEKWHKLLCWFSPSWSVANTKSLASAPHHTAANSQGGWRPVHGSSYELIGMCCSDWWERVTSFFPPREHGQCWTSSHRCHLNSQWCLPKIRQMLHHSGSADTNNNFYVVTANFHSIASFPPAAMNRVRGRANTCFTYAALPMQFFKLPLMVFHMPAERTQRKVLIALFCINQLTYVHRLLASVTQWASVSTVSCSSQFWPGSAKITHLGWSCNL